MGSSKLIKYPLRDRLSATWIAQVGHVEILNHSKSAQ
ncbi:unnamed protein product [Spirodela intermedia]|uniref:Uncharacterized protein n=1 Tax=Spirodela intermedia TaxID=51605 RepID=A0A7I8K2M9_SPIIN|nr:unnamed protein product [Spirodela intermedia]